jgi:hypothetical protein
MVIILFTVLIKIIQYTILTVKGICTGLPEVRAKSHPTVQHSQNTQQATEGKWQHVFSPACYFFAMSNSQRQ